jgi:predicted component of type VI protein secretion system
MSDVARPAGEVSLQLLDPASGRPSKSWTFKNQDLITIGRSAEQDVELSDPFISRSHAKLVFRDGEWSLVSLGLNGVVVANQLISGSFRVNGDIRFRLGPEGPTLHFRTKVENSDNRATMFFDFRSAPTFQLDQRKLQAEVGQIAEGDYFQSLQQRVKQLRQNRAAP